MNITCINAILHLMFVKNATKQNNLNCIYFDMIFMLTFVSTGQTNICLRKSLL